MAASRCHYPTGWIRYTPAKQRRHRPTPLVLPLVAPAAKLLRQLYDRPQRLSSPAVFPWPLSRKSLDAQWDRLTDAAGIRTYAGLDRLAIKHLRSNAATWHESTTPGIGPHVLGHAPRGVTAGHYTQTIPQLVRHFEKFEATLAEAFQQ